MLTEEDIIEESIVTDEDNIKESDLTEEGHNKNENKKDVNDQQYMDHDIVKKQNKTNNGEANKDNPTQLIQNIKDMYQAMNILPDDDKNRENYEEDTSLKQQSNLEHNENQINPITLNEN